MAKSFKCTIVTPTQTVLDDEVDYATLPAWDGQLGVMYGESPMLVRLGSGQLRLDFPEGGSRWYLLEGGFAKVEADSLTLLTDRATSAERLSVSEAEKQLDESLEAVRRVDTNTEAAQQKVQTAYARLALAREHAARSHAI